jgi:flagellar biosynthesis chaperone FliJ
MSRDPLATLARLRRLAVTEARRDLAEALAAEDPGAYAAWLPRGLAEARAAAAKAEAASRATARQRQALAEARAAERAVEIIAERRAADAARAAERRAQALLDDAAHSVRRFRSEGGRRR